VLLQILAKKYWKKDWSYYFNTTDSLAESCLMIGDKVFHYKEQFDYSYDLAEAWKSMTGLPMVFAVWIAKPGIPNEIIDAIDRSFETGMEIVQYGQTSLESWQKEYLLKRISYPLDGAKMEALRLFQSLM
jgi:chorismate dehydratase